jgi:prophage maintenance system killer protein
VSADEFDLGDILAIHVGIMGRLGKWPAPLREEEALVTVLGLAHSARLEGADVIRRSAILAVENEQARPFDDGNLPTTFATLESYLSINGYVFHSGAQRRIGQLLRVVAEEHEAQVAIQLLEARLRSAVVPE